MTKRLLGVLALGALAFSGCSSGEGDEVGVTAPRLPENLCSLVPDSTMTALSVEEEAHRTTNDSLPRATCTMVGTGPDVESLSISVNLYSGGDAESADGFARDDLNDWCASLAARAEGTYLDGEAGCSATTPEPDGETTTVVAAITSSHGVLQVHIGHAAGDAPQVEEQFDDEIDAVVDSIVERSDDDWT